MIRNGWWCPDHGVYNPEWLTVGFSFIPLGAVIQYSPIFTYDNSHKVIIDGPFYKQVQVFSVRLFNVKDVILCDARDLKEFEDNLPSGLLFNCPKPE